MNAIEARTFCLADFQPDCSCCWPGLDFSAALRRALARLERQSSLSMRRSAFRPSSAWGGRLLRVRTDQADITGTCAAHCQICPSRSRGLPAFAKAPDQERCRRSRSRAFADFEAGGSNEALAKAPLISSRTTTPTPRRDRLGRLRLHRD